MHIMMLMCVDTQSMMKLKLFFYFHSYECVPEQEEDARKINKMEKL